MTNSPAYSVYSWMLALNYVSLFHTEYAGESSKVYWVCEGISHICTEYAGEFAIFILSMGRNLISVSNTPLSISILSMGGEFVTLILSMRGNFSFLYWVCGRIHHIDTEYAGESDLGVCATYINSAPHTQCEYDEFPRILSINMTNFYAYSVYLGQFPRILSVRGIVVCPNLFANWGIFLAKAPFLARPSVLGQKNWNQSLWGSHVSVPLKIFRAGQPQNVYDVSLAACTFHMV